MGSAPRAIIVGTGAGGLAAAAYLARDGFDVLALEQAEEVGGFLRPFRRDGFEFDPGLHYVGACRPGQMLHTVLAGLGLAAESMFCELDPDGFDVFRFPDLEVRACRGLDAYCARLSALFPDDAAGLTRLFARARRIERVAEAALHLAERRPRPGDLRALPALPGFLGLRHRSLAELLATTLRSPRARAVLAAQSGDYGLPPSRASAIGALLNLLHYADGAFFPRGGSGALRDAIVEVTTRAGARFETGCRVRRILIDAGRVVGVEAADGRRFAADIVVSDADPTVTLGELVGAEHLPRALAEKVRASEPSLGTFTIFLGMRRDLRRHGLGRSNLWLYPTWDIEALYGPALAGSVGERFGLFLSPNAQKDDSGRLAPDGCSTLEITTVMSFAAFRPFLGSPPGERGPAYAALKASIADRMLAVVDTMAPGLIGDVVVREYATPLTSREYVGAVDGGTYGPAATPAQEDGYRTTTPIHGLFLAGAGVLGVGVAPCLFSGRLAAIDVARAHGARRHGRAAADA